MFEAAAKSGAILAGGERDYIKHSTNFSKNLGILFQIKDDLLDYQIDSHSGKPNFQDIKEKMSQHSDKNIFPKIEKLIKETLNE